MLNKTRLHYKTSKIGQNAIDQDKIDIAYYAKKLGIKKKRTRNSKELHMDGLDDLLDGLLDEDGNSDNETDANTNNTKELTNIKVDKEFHIESNSNSSGIEEDGLVTVYEGQDIDMDQCDDADGNKEIDFDLSMNGALVQEDVGSSRINLDIPPQNKGEHYSHLRRQLQGLVNRLSDSNIESIIIGIGNCFESNPRHDVTEILTSLLILAIAEKIHLLDTFVCTYAALISAIHSSIGSEIGAQMLQSSVEMFLKALSQSKQINLSTEEHEASSRQATNLAALLAFLYNFQQVSCILIYDIVRECISGLSETEVEVILKFLRLCGQQLRSDDHQALKDIVSSVQIEASKRDMTNSRLRFLVESILDLKNHRKRKVGKVQILSDQQERLKKAIKCVLVKRRGCASEPLRCSLDEIRSVHERGRWWVVGAAWAGKQRDSACNSNIKTQQGDVSRVSSSIGGTDLSALLELAKKQGMNTEIRQNVFVALMSAEDWTDALSRLDALKLTPPRDREVVRVLVHCCAREKGFNPYYALVAEGLVERHFSMKITFQYALWDALKEMGADDARKAMHLARLYGFMIAKGCMSLNVLKILHFVSLTAGQQTFLTALFENILKFQVLYNQNKRALDAMNGLLIDGIKDEVVTEGLALFLSTFKGSQPLIAQHAKLFRQRLLNHTM